MIDVVMVTNGKRPELLEQSLFSLVENASDRQNIHPILVVDGATWNQVDRTTNGYERTVTAHIDVQSNVGASRCRNIGASSVPKYKRGEYVTFCDDDVYMCPGWDERLVEAIGTRGMRIVSGHAHPYNHTVLSEKQGVYETNVLSTVHMFMPWSIWDEVGYFVEPGGPGGSEDVDYCKRAKQLGYVLYVTNPHCVIHTGLTNSKGQEIVGYEHVVIRNNEIEKVYSLRGKVLYA